MQISICNSVTVALRLCSRTVLVKLFGTMPETGSAAAQCACMHREDDLLVSSPRMRTSHLVFWFLRAYALEDQLVGVHTHAGN